MLRLHDEYPQYNWAQNKGYPTKAHREAIAEYEVAMPQKKLQTKCSGKPFL